MKKVIAMILVVCAVVILTGCVETTGRPDAEAATRTVTDALGREVVIPLEVDTVASIGGAARLVSYAGGANRLVGVTEMDKSNLPAMPYSVVYADHFSGLVSVGTGGANDTPYPEELITLAPDVIFAMTDADTMDNVQQKTGIPVVAVYPIGIFGEGLYESLRLAGDILGTDAHVEGIIQSIETWRQDLDDRTNPIPEADKPSVYAGGVSFRGAQGFEGTFANYPPFTAIHANHVTDETGQSGALLIDREKIVEWDPDIIFLNPANLYLVEEDYRTNRSFYDSLTAVQAGEIYTQISYNYNWTNIEIAIANAYYAGSVIYPDAFADVDPIEKADEIFTVLLGRPFYRELADAGYAFERVTIGNNPS